MKKISLMTVVALTVLLIAAVPAVSATYEQTLTDEQFNSIEYDRSCTQYTANIHKGKFFIEFYKIENYENLAMVFVRTPSWSGAYTNLTLAKEYDSRPENVQFVDYATSKTIGYGTLTYNIFYDSNYNPTSIQFWFDIDEWDVKGLSGNRRIDVKIEDDSPLMRHMIGYYKGGKDINADSPVRLATTAEYTWSIGGHYIIHNKFQWSNDIRITDDVLSLIRNNEYSILEIETGEDVLREEGYDDRHIRIFPPISWTVTNPAGTVFTGKYPEDDHGAVPDDSNVIVYVKNSQTGALIANSRIVIDGLVDGEYYPVVNRTEPSGIFSITLQPTGGGKPNPDGYRLIVTADGYNNPMPEINFTVDDSKNYIHCLLDPIAGGPVNENKTFIDFFVRDMSSNPISGATVKFGKFTLITNSAGYTVFEVDKNNNYSWTISKSGYGSLTGNAVIGNDPRHTINTVLAPIVTPTITTSIPTSPPIGPTPTMTAPTGESVSNLLEWFAAHFGMILGGGVEIGKIFMWLCFTVPVGVYVGREAKAGAAGFMAGAGIVTLFFVLIGWVPIWLVVLLALIIGLLYAKEFNSPDNGGGR